MLTYSVVKIIGGLSRRPELRDLVAVLLDLVIGEEGRVLEEALVGVRGLRPVAARLLHLGERQVEAREHVGRALLADGDRLLDSLGRRGKVGLAGERGRERVVAVRALLEVRADLVDRLARLGLGLGELAELVVAAREVDARLGEGLLSRGDRLLEV